jgi:hypothetical protein
MELDDRPVMAPDFALPGWEGLDPGEQRRWWEELWTQATALSARYRLALRSGWWEDAVQVELLATLAAWVGLFDSGAWTDPPSKMQLLFELDRVRGMLRGGEHMLHAARDRDAFEQHLEKLGCHA